MTYGNTPPPLVDASVLAIVQRYSSPLKKAAYLIDQDPAGIFKAVNGRTGTTDYGGKYNEGGVDATDFVDVCEAAANSLLYGGLVELKEGSFPVKQKHYQASLGFYYGLTVHKPKVVLAGQGPSTILKLIGNNCRVVTSDWDAVDFEIKDMTIDGNHLNDQSTTGAADGLVVLNQGDRAKAHDLHIINGSPLVAGHIGADALGTYMNNYVSLYNIIAENCEHGLVFTHSSKSHAYNSLARNCNGVGFLIHGNCFDDGFHFCTADHCGQDGFQIAKWLTYRPLSNKIDDCWALFSKRWGINVYATSINILKGNHVYNNALSGIRLGDDGVDASTGNIIQGNQIGDFQGTPTQDYGVEETGFTDASQILDNYFFSNVLGPYLIIGEHTQRRGNMDGFTRLEEKRGSATIPSGSTYIDVTHSCLFTPDLSDINIELLNATTNDIGDWRVTSVNSTQFRISVRNDPGASGAIFAYGIRRIYG